jgi:transposase-like protein
VDPAQLLEQHLASASPDLVREMIATFANAMMSAQADQVCGAGYGERSPEALLIWRAALSRGRVKRCPQPSSWTPLR